MEFRYQAVHTAMHIQGVYEIPSGIYEWHKRHIRARQYQAQWPEEPASNQRKTDVNAVLASIIAGQLVYKT